MFTSSSTSTRGGYLQRDVGLFVPRLPAESLERLWTMLAHRLGGLLNASRLSTSLGFCASTGKRYIDLPVDLFLLHRLPPYRTTFGKIGSEHVSTPRTKS